MAEVFPGANPGSGGTRLGPGDELARGVAPTGACIEKKLCLFVMNL